MSGRAPPVPPVIPRLNLQFVGPEQQAAAIARWADDVANVLSVEFGRLLAAIEAPVDGRMYVRMDGLWVAVSEDAGPNDIPFDFGVGTPAPSDESAVVVVRDSQIPADFVGSDGAVITPGVGAGTVDLLIGSTAIGTATISTGGVYSFAATVPGSPIAVPAGSLVRAVVGGVVPAGLAGVRFTLAVRRL